MSAASSLMGSDRPTVLLIGLQGAESREIADRTAKERWRTVVCSNPNQARALLQGSSGIQPAAVILGEDVDPGRTYHSISDLKRRDPRVPVFLVGDSSAVGRSLRAVLTGTDEYLTRPLLAERVLQKVRAAVDATVPRRQDLERWTSKIPEPVTLDSLIGESSAFREAVRLASQCATGSGHVLIEGESGTGKNTLARAIHLASPRSQMPFETLQVTGASELALGSMLFGHAPGAFVGAFEKRTGLLQQCTGATLLIDQIERLPVPLQQRLGQALHECRVRSIGDTRDYPVELRVVALSSHALSDLVRGGKFDARLFEVLGQTRIELPPLRMRRDDIGLLARSFLRTIPGPDGAGCVSLDEAAIALLRLWDWPGNIRQLHEALLRAAAHSFDRILRPEHFTVATQMSNGRGNGAANAVQHATDVVSPFTDQGHVRPLGEIEAEVIRLAVERYQGRMSEVARRLGIGRSTLYRRLAEIEGGSPGSGEGAPTEPSRT